MAVKVESAIQELITEFGVKNVSKTLTSIEKVNSAQNETIAARDKHEKGIAGFAKNSTSAFSKQAQGLGGLVHVYATIKA